MSRASLGRKRETAHLAVTFPLATLGIAGALAGVGASGQGGHIAITVVVIGSRLVRMVPVMVMMTVVMRSVRILMVRVCGLEIIRIEGQRVETATL